MGSELKTLLIDGKKISWRESGHGQPLVLVHGFPLDSRAWEPCAALLAASRRVIVPDLPGFGGSELPDGIGGMAIYAEAISRLLAEMGIRQACFAGHSMGGYVCLQVAHSHATLVTGLALVGSQVFADAPENRQRRMGQIEELKKAGMQCLLPMAEKLAGGKEQEWLAELMLGQEPDAAIFALQAMAGRSDHSITFRDLTVPRLIIHGDADVLVGVEKARHCHEISPQARLVIQPGVGHSPMIEAPGDTARQILSYFG